MIKSAVGSLAYHQGYISGVFWTSENDFKVTVLDVKAKTITPPEKK